MFGFCPLFTPMFGFSHRASSDADATAADDAEATSLPCQHRAKQKKAGREDSGGERRRREGASPTEYHLRRSPPCSTSSQSWTPEIFPSICSGQESEPSSWTSKISCVFFLISFQMVLDYLILYI